MFCSKGGGTKKRKLITAVIGCCVCLPIAAGMLALSMNMSSKTCKETMEVEPAGEVGVESTQLEPDQGEGTETEEVAAEMNPEAEKTEGTEESEEIKETEGIEETAKVEETEEEFNENMEFDALTQMSEYAGKKVDKVYVNDNILARTWLRTPGAAQNATAVIDIEGHLEREGDYNCMAVNAVRSVMWVTKTPEIEAQMAAFKELPIGSYVTLGYYEQNTKLDGLEPIEWQILDRKDGKALLISRYILDSYTYDYDAGFLEVRNWLNNDFYNTAFNEEKEYIVETNQEYDGFWAYTQGKTTYYKRFVDSVFLLSSTEVETYFDGNNIGSRATVGTAYAKDIATWWMRDKKIKYEWDSPGSEDIACVNKFGEFMQARGTKGIRPAIWVDMAVFKSDLTVPKKQGYGAIDSVLHLVEGLEGNVAFGAYEQDGNLDNGPEPIEWIIFDKEDDKMLLASKYILDAQYYYEINTSAEGIGWEDSTVRTWLNSDFYNTAFNDIRKEIYSVKQNSFQLEKYLYYRRNRRLCISPVK